ncbi:CGNR zinc finger domain-containing protein [Streptomyces cocklensis]|uniref:DNA-binding transcriptional activator of the SARP family n=1 Tax=Actinacidiphila cocklensis TaxID=887465 RepID=A0A9W4E4H5_9ACTN|nr:BTAD domain-containing putative transcriptional regulator [Actinacidiphila cocklensis]MDD1062384.1 CGNR zinc finger domain-containing protein [Actinacidiphila cocklensis]CAG6392672.1 DNA-binding transcriptional activator of the SARP family [Actinacidiphila cocklensis]
MEFQLLGPFEGRHEGERVMLGERRQERCLLAILLLDAGRVVTTARLIDLLWNGSPPVSARGTVHTYIGRVRARLRAYGLLIETRHDGYVLDPGHHTIDAQEFLKFVGEAAMAGDPEEQTRWNDRALALWHGPLLADVIDDELRGRLGGRLTELRLSALEQRAEVRLTMGLHERVLADLAPLAHELPSRERLVVARMTALYRSGRRAEALEVYRHARRVLVTELGIEPGPALATLHDRILRADPRLDRPPAPLYAVRVGEEWLPWSTSGHPALEFCNTYAGWGNPGLPGAEWLRRYSTLAVWAGHMDLADDPVVDRLLQRAREFPEEATAALEEARLFRKQLYACLTDPHDARAFNAVAAVVQDAAGSAVFTLGDDGLGRWRLSPAAGLRLPVLATARGAAELLADPRRFTIRSCASDDCGWVFLDHSGRRRWCSLATCGSRRAPAGG